MPLRDGPSAAARIRQIEAKRGSLERVPIVGLSADCQQSARILSLSSGMHDYLNKPLRSGELVKLLRTYVLPKMGSGTGRLPPPPRVLVSTSGIDGGSGSPPPSPLPTPMSECESADGYM